MRSIMKLTILLSAASVLSAEYISPNARARVTRMVEVGKPDTRIKSGARNNNDGFLYATRTRSYVFNFTRFFQAN